GADVSETIADTPVTVREQQTHFSRDPIGRSAPTPHGSAPDRAPVAEPRTTALPRPDVAGPAPSTTKGGDAVQAVAVQKATNAEPLSRDSGDAATPAAPVAGRILEACDEASPPSQPLASSSAWLSAD